MKRAKAERKIAEAYNQGYQDGKDNAPLDILAVRSSKQRVIFFKERHFTLMPGDTFNINDLPDNFSIQLQDLPPSLTPEPKHKWWSRSSNKKKE
jgi:hypothetical protein